MTNYINDFFVNIGKSLSDAIPTNSGNTHATHFLTSKLNSIFLQPITSFEIKSLNESEDIYHRYDVGTRLYWPCQIV